MIEELEILMKAHPYIGAILYVGITMLQVIIALIPGEPVEILGGYAFGAVQGTLLNLLGATLGSLLVFGVVRKYGVRMLGLFFSQKDINSLGFLQHSKKRNVLLAIIFILPGTPKDLLCYFAGLTDMKWKVWIWVCSLGRLPSVVSSMIGGDALETKSYTNALVIFAITLFLSIIGIIIYKSICKQHEQDKSWEEITQDEGK